MRISRALFHAASVIALAAPIAPAQAQQTSNQTETGAIEEVVVTAEKRPERLKDAPVSISVVSTEALFQANAFDISQLNNLVPSVELNGTFNGRVPYGIRGISTDSNEQTVGIPSGVAVMIDGVPVPSDSYDGNILEDIQQIEVLKGPQATLGGRTAAAGEINIITRGPSDTLTATLNATATNTDGGRVNGFVAGPISDQLEYSVSGYYDHTLFPIENNATGNHSYQDAYGTRAKLRYQVNADLDLTLTGHLAQSQSYGGNFTYIYATPGATLLGAPPLTQALLLPGIRPSWSNENYNSSVPTSGARIIDTDTSLIINYRLGDLTLTSTTAYQFERQKENQDLFSTASITVPPGYGPPDPPATSSGCFTGGPQYFFQYLTHCTAPYFGDLAYVRQTDQQVSEEVKLVSPSDQMLSWFAGLFYSDTTINNNLNRPFVGALAELDVIPETATYDAYARATWKILPDTSVVGGLRFNYDVLSYTYNQTDYVVDNVDQGPAYSAGRTTSSTLVGDISLQHKFSETSMVYFTYSRGYSPEAYNTSQALEPSVPSLSYLKPVAQENVNSYELGAKGSYFDNRLSLNLALFDTIYDNYQVQTFASGGGTFPLLVLQSAGAETKGVELDTAIQPTDNLSLTVNAAYIDATFENYPDAPNYPGAASSTFNASGDPMPNSPKFKIDLGADQRIPLDIFDLTLNGTYAYRTSAQMLADQNPEAIQGAFGIFDLSATAASKSGTYALTFFVNNVTDKHYFADVEDFWGAPWGNSNMVVGEAAADASRYFGVRLSINY